MYIYLISFIVILLIFLFLYVTKKIEPFKNELLSFKKKKEYLLFSSIGKKSCYKQWLGKNKEYDVVLYLFETIPNFKSNEVDYYYNRKGFKFPNFYHFYKNFKNIIDLYKAVWIVDDDIHISTKNINNMFTTFYKHKLVIAQPAYTLHSYTPYSFLKKENNNKEIKFTNFIENGCVIIKPNFIPNVLDVFKYAKTGWGVDYILIKLLKDKYKTIYPYVGVINNVTIYHPGNFSSLDLKIPRKYHQVEGQNLLKRFNTNIGNKKIYKYI